MFTGIIEATAKVLSNALGSLEIDCPTTFTDLRIGSSISVAGVCLTIKKLNKKCIQFDVIAETLSKTTLRLYKEGDRVNLERAMKADGRLDGHIVQGHVEATGKVVSVSSSIPRPLPPEEEGENAHKPQMGGNMLFFSRNLRKKMTESESLLWKALRYDQIGVRFRRQFVLETRIMDFYAPSAKLCIEVDGGVHDSPTQKKEDLVRDQYLLKDHGIHTLRFANEEILKDRKNVVHIIQNFLKNVSPPPPEEGLGVEVNIVVPTALLPNIIPKGSIAIDGVSLTVASIEGDRITVALIPHTWENTTLGTLKEGDCVNIETDILARHAQKLKASS